MYNQVIPEIAYHLCRNEIKSTISLSLGKKTSYIANNIGKSKVSVMNLDKVNIDGEKTDYIIEKGEDKLIFVELKDSDIIKAIGQIDNTIESLIANSRKSSIIILARIIPTKVYSPDLRDNRFKRFELKLKSYHPENSIRVKSNILEETI